MKGDKDMASLKPGKGMLAVCSLGSLGLITDSLKKEITYPDGTKGEAWVGVHVTDKVAEIGSPWSSRNPTVVCRFDDLYDIEAMCFKVLGEF
jgi:hypothetical protein